MLQGYNYQVQWESMLLPVQHVLAQTNHLNMAEHQKNVISYLR